MTVAPFRGGKPPADMVVEQAFLGTLLVNNGVYHEVQTFLQAEHFVDPFHQWIYHHVGETVEAGHTVTHETVAAVCDEDQGAYLNQLALAYLTVVSARDYALTIRRLADARAVQSWCATAAQEVAESPILLDDIAEEGRTLFDGLGSERIQRRPTEQMGEAADGVLDDLLAIRARRAAGEALPYLETGLAALDAHIGGFRPGELIVVAGAPSMGKSAFAGAIAHNVARAGRPVFFQSLEMSKAQLVHRELARLSGVPVWRLRDAKADDEQVDRLRDAAAILKRTPLHVDDNAGVTIGSLRLDAQRWRRQSAMDLLVVDYLQLMSGETSAGNRVEEVGRISRGLKIMARDFEIPVIAVSQLSRAVEQRDEKKPILADLRESGSIEQDADVVLFLWRAAYYHAREKPGDTRSNDFYAWQADQQALDRVAEVIIGKQRQGVAGESVEIAFDPDTIAFS